jgi:hypothetical protein
MPLYLRHSEDKISLLTEVGYVADNLLIIIADS